MKIGTKSLLYGVHQFALHPLLLFVAWWKLYGFPWDPRLWVAFLVHDWGYWGKPNMDGPEGETHPELGAVIMARIFGRSWGEFTVRHSRYYAQRYYRGAISRLCVADKLAIVLLPWWLYLPLASATGEITEYMHKGRTSGEGCTKRQWFAKMSAVVLRVVAEQKDSADTLGLVDSGFYWTLLRVTADLETWFKRRILRELGGGRHVDPDPVRCEECNYVTRRRHCVHGYTDDGSGYDVLPMDECPQCGREI